MTQTNQSGWRKGTFVLEVEGAVFLPYEVNISKPREKPPLNICGLLESVSVQMHPQLLE